MRSCTLITSGSELQSQQICTLLLPIDASLMSHVIAEYRVSSEMECGHRCLLTPKCVSFNYENDVETSTHVCEANDETDTIIPGDLVFREGFSYFKMVVS